MRGILVLVSTALLAQVTPATKSQPGPAKQRSTPATGAQRSTSRAAKPASAAKVPPPLTAATMTDEQKTIYALGLSISRSISQFDLSPAELDIVKQAITDAAAGKPAVEIETWGPKIQSFAQGRAQRVSDREKEASAAYLAKVATDPGVV